jgi:hypothetical protein
MISIDAIHAQVEGKLDKEGLLEASQPLWFMTIYEQSMLSVLNFLILIVSFNIILKTYQEEIRC